MYLRKWGVGEKFLTRKGRGDDVNAPFGLKASAYAIKRGLLNTQP